MANICVDLNLLERFKQRRAKNISAISCNCCGSVDCNVVIATVMTTHAWMPEVFGSKFAFFLNEKWMKGNNIMNHEPKNGELKLWKMDLSVSSILVILFRIYFGRKPSPRIKCRLLGAGYTLKQNLTFWKETGCHLVFQVEFGGQTTNPEGFCPKSSKSRDMNFWSFQLPYEMQFSKCTTSIFQPAVYHFSCIFGCRKRICLRKCDKKMCYVLLIFLTR